MPSLHQRGLSHPKRRRRCDHALWQRMVRLAWSMTLLFVLGSGMLLVSVAALRPSSLPRLLARDYSRVESVSRLFDALQLDPRPYLDFREPKSLLAKILVPRVPDTPANAAVRAELLAPFQGRSAWHIEEHKFTASTPEGEKHMTNLILTYNVNAPRRLVLAAHHDSKVSPKGFVGATDSAVPCAIIVDTALALEKAVEEQKAKGKHDHPRGQETGLQLIFFDGEEAYVQWTQSDSVYGSRALALQWARSFFTPQLVKRRNTPGYSTMRVIDSIEHFVLLDLLGTPHPRVPSYFGNTHWMYDEVRSAEQRLASAGLLYPKDRRGAMELPPKGGSGTPMLPGLSAGDQRLSFFPDSAPSYGGIDDDHRPFLQNGVPILHLIPSPFPSVWHRMSDDSSALDWPTIHAWAMIMRVFVIEYFGLRDDLTVQPSARDVREAVLIGRLQNDFVSESMVAAAYNATASPLAC